MTVRLVPCHDPKHRHDQCPTCDGHGLLEYDTLTGDLRPCKRKQELWEPLYRKYADKEGKDRLY